MHNNGQWLNITIHDIQARARGAAQRGVARSESAPLRAGVRPRAGAGGRGGAQPRRDVAVLDGSVNNEPVFVRVLRASKRARIDTMSFTFDASPLDAEWPAAVVAAAPRDRDRLARLMRDNGNADAALLSGVAANDPEDARVTLELGAADVHVDNELPLRTAAEKQNAFMVDLLLRHGADLGAAMIAAVNDEERIQTSLLIGIAARRGESAAEPFRAAVASGDAAMVRRVSNNATWLKRRMPEYAGIEVNALNGIAVRIAAFTGSADVVSTVLDLGGDPNALGGFESQERRALRRIGLEHAYFRFRSALAIAACCGGGAAVLRALVERGADVSINDSEPLLAACCVTNVSSVEYLLSNGAAANARDSLALVCAVDADLPLGLDALTVSQVVRLLLTARPPADARARGSEAACLAARNNYEGALELMLAAGADSRARDDEPLVAAAANGHVDIVRLLLRAGVPASARFNQPVVLAAAQEYEEVVSELLAHGASRRLALAAADRRRVPGSSFGAMRGGAATA